MKVFVALLLVISSVAARGSGPYLPSGWRPDGPAFYLPSEIIKPVARTVQETLVEETEASGSDALREYGPPKLEVSLNVNQGLPDVVTEQTFFRANQEQVVDALQEGVEANTEQIAAVLEEISAVTESQTAEAKNAEVETTAAVSEVEPTAGASVTELVEQNVESSDIQQTKEEIVAPTIVIPENIVVPTSLVEELVVPLYKQDLVQDAVPTLSEIQTSVNPVERELIPEAIPTSDLVSSVTTLEQELTQDVVSNPTEEVIVEKVAETVNNIAEAILNLEKEVTAVEVQGGEVNSAVTSSQFTSGSLEQAPEGFLEYGPPGFLEYGPPKPEPLEGLAAEVANVGAIENNEVRRRRFSPKFRSPKKH